MPHPETYSKSPSPIPNPSILTNTPFLNSSLPTPSNPSASGITYFGASTIHAPGALTWSAFLDFDSYPKWNTFTPRISFPAALAESRPVQVGDDGHLDATIDSPDAKPTPTKVKVSVLQGPQPEVGTGTGTEAEVGAKWRICWKAQGFPSFSLRCERVMEVEVLERDERGGARCAFRTWETMDGPLAWAVKKFVGKGLDVAFQRCAEDLRRWVEGGMGEKGEEGVGEGRGEEEGEGKEAEETQVVEGKQREI